MSLTNNRGSSTIAKNIINESKNQRIKRLRKFKWGMGLEHEMQLFHRPKYDEKKKITDAIMFNPKDYIREVLATDKVDHRERKFLESLPFEPTGRICNGKVVLEPTPVPMPEFITENPFSSLETGKRPIESFVEELKDKEEIFNKVLHMNPKAIKLIEKYGPLSQYPYGMTSYFKYATKSGSTGYTFKKTSSGKDKILSDYLGSYHLTLTLPFTEKTSLKEFTRRHQNFANQIQWIEPLLVVAFFSCDQNAVGTSEKRIKGSYRVARIGWGNFAGSDVRKFNKGIGRYANVKSFWRKGFEFFDSNKVKYCEKLSDKLKKKEPGAVSGYSSNFRTFGSNDPERPWHRESGIGITKPNGVELRIFDHFNSNYLNELCRLVIYVAENSRTTKAKDYVYNNKYWIEALRRIMLEGWKAELPPQYINLIRKNLGISINTKSLLAYDVLYTINEELFKKNKDGDWSFLLLRDGGYKDAPKLPHINRNSWEMAFMMKLNNNDKLIVSFNKLLSEINGKTIDVKKFKEVFYKYFDEKDWKRDVIDVIYYIESIDFVKLSFTIDGQINKIIVGNKIEKINNFNELIIRDWSREFFDKYMEYISKIVK